MGAFPTLLPPRVHSGGAGREYLPETGNKEGNQMKVLDAICAVVVLGAIAYFFARPPIVYVHHV